MCFTNVKASCVQGFVCAMSVDLTLLAKKNQRNKNVESDEGAEPSSESEKNSFSNGNCKVSSYRSANSGPRQRAE